MKILIIHNKYLLSAGGEDTTVEAESKLLRSNGHDVEILFFDNATMAGGLAGKIKAGAHAIYNGASARIVRKTIQQFQPDIVHIHNLFFTASPSVIIEVHKLKIPLVVTIHNYRLICSNSLLLRNNKVCELCVHHIFPWYGVKYGCYHNSSVESAVVGSISAVHKTIGTWRRKVDKYIVPAEFIRSRLINSSLNLPPEKVFVKSNFVEDPGVSSPDGRKDFFLFIGRLSTEKGVHVLLKCFREIPDVELVIAGDGPERECLIKEFGHLHNVAFKGHLAKEEVMSLLKNCTAAILPSICYEGLPLSIVEAFATGTPVIASRLGAMQEMINDGTNGLLFDPGNHNKLKEAILKFQASENRDFYNGARASYENHYHPLKCYNDVMNIYHSAISGKNNEN